MSAPVNCPPIPAKTVLILWILAFAPFATAQTESAADIWQTRPLETATIERLRQETQAEIAAVPSEAPEGSAAASLRSALSQRATLLQDLATTIKGASALRAELAGLEERKAKVDTEKKTLAALPAVEKPTSPTNEALTELEARIQVAKEGLNAMTERMRGLTAGQSDAAQRRASLQERRTKLLADAQATEASLSTTDAGPARRLAEVQLENIRIELRLIAEQSAHLELAQEAATKIPPVLSQESANAQTALSRMEAELSRYQEALERHLAAEQTRIEGELETKKRATAVATTTGSKYLAQAEQRIAEVEFRAAELNRRKADLSRWITEQEKRVEGLEERLKSLKELTAQRGESEHTGQRIRSAYNRVRQLQKNREIVLGPAVETQLDEDRDRRFALSETIHTLPAQWEANLNAVLEEIPPEEGAVLRARSATLREDLHSALMAEQSLIAEVIALENRLEDLNLQTLEGMDRLERFILPRLFWIRDAKPVRLESLTELQAEAAALLTWLRDTGQQILRESKPLLSFQWIFSGTLIFILMPAVFAFLRRWLRKRFGQPNSAGAACYAVWGTLGTALLLPIYFYLCAWVTKNLPMPAVVAELASSMIYQFAVVLTIWCVVRGIFRSGGLGEVVGSLSPAATKCVRRFADRTAIAFLVIYLVPRMLAGPPFDFLMLPHLAEIILGVAAAVILWSLIRRSSPVVISILAGSKTGLLRRNWSVAVLVIMCVLSIAIVISLMGYRYSATRIYFNMWMTALTGLALLGVHLFIRELILKRLAHDPGSWNEITTLTPDEAQNAREMNEGDDRFARDENPAPVKAEVEPRAAGNSVETKRLHAVRAFAKVVLMVVGVLLLAFYWKLDEQVLRSLDSIQAFAISTGAGKEIVSYADVILALMAVAITIMFVRFLPSLFEFAVFPRFDFDSGLRYAIVTIARYSAVLIGGIIALSLIRLDIGRVGWLMAAVGFGLGFGMQEIFSNFVSGIILLIERPVRVGDVVKVGAVTGTVTRVNIRATTVTDFDRLENIIPNKQLITGMVTNWTLADKTTRLVIPIGVAYGSDIDKVTRLLEKVAKEHKDVLSDPAPMAVFMAHGPSSLDFELRCFVADTDLRMSVTHTLNSRINEMLKRYGIGIPYPQMDISIRDNVLSMRDG